LWRPAWLSPWSNILNSAILADIPPLRRGIGMQVGVFYFYCAAGIAGSLLEVPDLGRDEILRLLDNYAPLAAAG